MIREVLDSYYKKYQFKPVVVKTGVVNPGAKSEESLLDKVVRNIEMGNKNTDFRLGNSPDMARCTIIVDSYDSIPDLLLRMKPVFPNMTGYISRCDNGYRGVHINIMIDGMKTEVQLCTSEAFEYGQAAEHIYKRWRSFSPDLSLETLQQKIQSGEITPSDKVLAILASNVDDETKLKQAVLQMSAEQREQYTDTNSLFRELHQNGQFANAERNIESILLYFGLDNQDTRTINPELLQRFALNPDGTVNRDLAKSYISRIHVIAETIQEKLISDMEKVSTIDSQHRATLDANTIQILALVLDCYDYALSQHTDDPNNYLLNNSINKSYYAQKFTLYCREQNITFEDLTLATMSEFMVAMHDPVNDFPGVVTPDELYNAFELGLELFREYQDVMAIQEQQTMTAEFDETEIQYETETITQTDFVYVEPTETDNYDTYTTPQPEEDVETDDYQGTGATGDCQSDDVTIVAA